MKSDHIKPYTLVVVHCTFTRALRRAGVFFWAGEREGGLGTMAPYNMFMETTSYNITQHVMHVLFLILIKLTPTLPSTLSTR